MVLSVVRMTIGVLAVVFSQASAVTPFMSTGQVRLEGKERTYLVRNLPVSSFPDLPAGIVSVLQARNCLIPQTYEAHRPENVIHGSFEHPGSSDWVVLCSARDEVSLLVFFASSPSGDPITLETLHQANCLQPHDSSGQLGFNRGIDTASPKRIHEAQAGRRDRTPTPDHDSIAESILDHKTVYHLFRNGVWEEFETE